MDPSSRSREERAQEIYAEFIQNRGAAASSEFFEWMQKYPDYAEELTGLHRALQQIEPHLPEANDEEPTDGPESLGLDHELEVVEPLGDGAYGTVYRARDPRLNRDVALKVLKEKVSVSPRMRKRFVNEARALAQLDHPNIVRIYSVYQEEGEIRICLELIEGKTLQQLVDDNGPFASKEVALLGIELCKALAAIHGKGLLHLDIKPGNVMRSKGGRIVLLDFGFARDAEVESGPVGGTPPFMSPEHFKRPDQLGATSDLYSLGVLMYWVVTGSYPFPSKEFGPLREAVLAGKPTPVLDARPGVDLEVARVIERAMARHEQDRYQSAGELEQALRGVLTDLPSSAPSRFMNRRIAMAGAAVLLPALAVIGGRSLFGAGSFEVDYQFYRIGPNGDEPLNDGDEVELGERIYLEVQGQEPFYLYVFNEDTDLVCYSLYPHLQVEPVPAGRPIRIPRSSDDSNWTFSTPSGGVEHLFLIASRSLNEAGERMRRFAPRPELEIQESKKRVGDASPEELQDVLRGLGLESAAVSAPRSPKIESLVDYFGHFERGLSPNDEVFYAHLELRSSSRDSF